MEYNKTEFLDVYRECNRNIKRFSELKKLNAPEFAGFQYEIKCNAALMVIKNSMEDALTGIRKEIKTTAELCFLIRNIDVSIECILSLNNVLFETGLNKQNKAVKICFEHPEVVKEFRKLRSFVLAHPINTSYTDNNGNETTAYIEDVLPKRNLDSLFGLSEEHDFALRMTIPSGSKDSTESKSGYIGLKIDTDIVPMMEEIKIGLSMISKKAKDKIDEIEKTLKETPLVLDRSSKERYIISLDKELQKRYPSEVEDTLYDDGTKYHWSIIYNCLAYYSAKFKNETQKRYDIFLQYITKELQRIENDLQSMTYSEEDNDYFNLFYNNEFAKNKGYEKEKVGYLKESDNTSYTKDIISDTTKSDILWGIQAFNCLIPDIEQYIPIDTDVPDKWLYCEYIAANYLSNEKVKE